MKRILIILGLFAVSGFCLWYTFRGVDYSTVVQTVRDHLSSWPMFLLSGLVMMMNIVFRGFRYHRILASYPEVGLKRSCTITSIMFLGNSILPLRAGEAIRIYLPYRFFRIPIPTSMAFHGADRMFDMAAMLILLVVSLWVAGDSIAQEARNKPVEMFGSTYTFDGLVEQAKRGSVLILVVGFSGIVALCAFPEKLKRVLALLASPFGEGLVQFTERTVDHFHAGVAIFRSPKDAILAAFWTVLVWWMVILNVQILAGVFEAPLTWAQAGLVVFLVAIAVSLPQAPGYVGPFHLGFQMALTLCFGVALPTATAIAYLAHFFQIVPVILLGFVAMSVEGLSISSFSEAQETIEHEIEEADSRTHLQNPD